MASDLTRWRWLHPASVAVNLLPRTWRVVRGLWPLALAFLWRGSADETSLWVNSLDVGIVLLFFALTVGGTLMHWLTLRYRVFDGRLEIRTGLLNRQVRTIDPARIQNIELVRTISHRLSGLVEVRIETASGTEVEGLLSALTVDEAEAMRTRLETLRAVRRKQDPDAAEPEPQVLVSNGLGDLFMYGATAGRLGAAAVAFGIIYEGIAWIAPDQLGTLAAEAVGWRGLVTAIAVLTGAWLIGLVGTVVRHWGFRLSRTHDALVVESGLTTRRRLELPMAKVQVAMTSETLPRRWIGFGSLTVETAAGRSDKGGTERRAAMVPVVPRARLAELVREVQPDLDVDPWEVTLERPHPRALARVVGRRVVQGLLLTALVAAVLWPWGLLAALVIPVGAALAVMDWRHQGWLVTERVVVARRGWLHRRLIVVSRRKLQSAVAIQGILLRRLGLGEVIVRVAGSRVALPLVAWERALEVLQELADPPMTTPDTASTEPTGPTGAAVLP